MAQTDVNVKVVKKAPPKAILDTLLRQGEREGGRENEGDSK